MAFDVVHLSDPQTCGAAHPTTPSRYPAGTPHRPPYTAIQPPQRPDTETQATLRGRPSLPKT
ncbi:MAG: hypothetical protein MR301_02735 [Prevotella sp.]|nr:hypothetical protein [Prevotella sp.]MDD7046317.1 hypothetical protein [Prevotella sp.]MDY5546057.1 hypothetical protein [Prevotella sp.]